MLRICARARPHLSDYLDGELTPPLLKLEVAVHAHLCPWCKPVYRALEQTREAVRALRDEDDAPPR
jgi:predicted anti-sigma-YlaC factor YlaD